MTKSTKNKETRLSDCVRELSKNLLSPMDLLPHTDFCEKCIDLVLNGEPENINQELAGQFSRLRQYLLKERVDDLRIVVFGGGSGLSNIIGGDSRMRNWWRDPFKGLKEIFPKIKSIVCVTDDGGSTGEMIKDLPIIALGDIRHVLLSSVQQSNLQKRYGLSVSETMEVVEGLAVIFNFRFTDCSITQKEIAQKIEAFKDIFPGELTGSLISLVDHLFSDERLKKTIKRPHCLGNLLLAAAIYKNIDPKLTTEELENGNPVINVAVIKGIETLAEIIGVDQKAVSPCNTTPAQLRFCYVNGVEATGENKSGNSARGFPVDHVVVDFSDTVTLPERILEDIKNADILIMAPGSLYSSIIPIFQVPGLAEAVRKNNHAQKMLISNLWVQAGETDIAISDPDRKFHVSDVIKAYQRNIPGGISDLFSEVLCLSLKDVPGSIIQNYALEGKLPIYLDKEIVTQYGLKPVECGIYSKKSLSERGVIQHDPEIIAIAVKTLYLAKAININKGKKTIPAASKTDTSPSDIVFDHIRFAPYPAKKYRLLKENINSLSLIFSQQHQKKNTEKEIKRRLLDIIWKHQDIPISHLSYVKGIVFIDKPEWKREQRWDKVYSFYDPDDCLIKIRSDQVENSRDLEVAFLIALGQSLLGNYAENKILNGIEVDSVNVGKIYHLFIRKEKDLQSYFSFRDIQRYLKLSRMFMAGENNYHFTRVVNGREGFTPPGVLMGLCYAWYLDNRLASHIEYKMALMKIHKSALIPEQLKMMGRRTAIINFFRESVFRE